MTYSGAKTAAESRELLGNALEALQQDQNVPPDVLGVASNIAQAVGALFEAERASSDVDGRASVKHAMGSLSQTMALLQEVKTQSPAIETATKALAQVMGKLFPLAQAVSIRPPRPSSQPGVQSIPAAGIPAEAKRSEPAPVMTVPPGSRAGLEANIGATTESNFFVGFSGDISDGGVFVATYQSLPVGGKVSVLVTLPGGYEQSIPGTVRFVRDPMDMDSEPRFGARLGPISHKQLDAVLERLVTDSEVRESCAPTTCSEDVLALGQPALMQLIDRELRKAENTEELMPAFEALLVELIVLSEAVVD